MRVPWRRRPWFTRDGDHLKVQIPPYPRTAAEVAARDLRALLVSTEDDPNASALLRRLFPTAYPAHPGLDREYHRYMRSELLASRLAALDVVETTLGQDRISEAEANAWLQGLNAARVLCGTMLGIDHDGWTPDELDIDGPDHPAAQVLALYEILGALVYELLEGLMGDLQEPDPDDPRIHPDLPDLPDLPDWPDDPEPGAAEEP